MPLSKHHIDTKVTETQFDRSQLADDLERALPQVVFAYLHGSSAATGVVPPHSDIDIALFVDRDASLSQVYHSAIAVAEDHAPGVRCDVGILNDAEPVFRYEVLKGHLLFWRDRERWLHFYSLTCREYETQLAHYERQWRYRIEARP